MFDNISNNKVDPLLNTLWKEDSTEAAAQSNGITIHNLYNSRVKEVPAVMLYKRYLQPGMQKLRTARV